MPRAQAYVRTQSFMDDAGIILGEAGVKAVSDTIVSIGRVLEGTLRFQIIPEVLARHARRAGEAFPTAYYNHLLLNLLGSKISVSAEPFSGFISCDVDFSDLGGLPEFKAGYHHQALEDTGYTAAQKRTKKGFVRHPNQVNLPYTGQPLLNAVGDEKGDERRTDFWEHIARGDSVYWANIKRGKGGTPIPVPSLDSVAEARVEAWQSMGVAPEWIILEYGTSMKANPKYSGGDFVFNLNTALNCVVNTYINNALTAAVKAAEHAAQLTPATYKSGRTGLQVRAVGGLEGGVGGRYVSPAAVGIDVTIPNVSAIDTWHCIDI